MDRLKGKVAIVTGSTSGIGIGIARLFAAEGARVIICGRRAEKGQAVVDRILSEGGEASFHTMDITSPESIERLFADTAEKFGRIDVLVNNDSPNADRSLINESLAREIERALATLTERESDIVKLFFGIGCQEMTLEEIGERFGLTRERVRQIKEKAIRRLRHTSRSKLLKTYLG